ncbi:carbohydrate ABC transporter permease [Paenibacillus sp. strain BS8-2]
MKLTYGEKMFQIGIYILLILLGFVTLYPVWNTLVISFNSGADTSLGGITLWPRAITLDNYKVVFNDGRILNAFVISVLRVVVGTLLSIAVTSLLAYGLSRRDVIFRNYYMVYCIITMFFSGGLIPTFILNNELGLNNTFWVLVIPTAMNVWNMIIFRTFFMQLPDGLEESAKIDGCGYFSTFIRIVVPVSGPVFATLSLFTAVIHWNDWFSGIIFINNSDLLPISSVLQQILISNVSADMLLQSTGGNASALQALERAKTVTSQSLSMATIVVATAPIIMVYPFLQRFFVKGVLVGSLKG